MSFEQLGNIGDFLGGIAVIATLIYLGIQIRSQTHESRLSATRELAADFHNAVRGLAHDKELLKVYHVGIADYRCLQDDDRLQLSVWLIHLFRVLEQQFLHTTHGNMDPVYFASINKAFVELLSFKGVQQWWELTNSMFAEDFKAHVDALILKAKSMSSSSSFTNDKKD